MYTSTKNKKSITKLFLAHPFKGVFIKNLNSKKRWQKIIKGIYRYSGGFEEVSDLSIIKDKEQFKLYASNNFTPNIYQFNFKANKWVKLFKLKEKFAIVESLFVKSNHIYFVTNLGAMEFDKTKKSLSKLEFKKIFNRFKQFSNDKVLSMNYIKNGNTAYNLSELWAIFPPQMDKYQKIANKKKGLYLQAGIARSKKKLGKIRNIMVKTGMNMVTIDMKDDFGHLRFKPSLPLLKKMGKVSRPVDLKKFVKYMKEKNIYLVARVVVFKDKWLYHYKNFKYAVKDRKSKKAWRALVKKSKKSGGGLKKNHEYWVDPYSEKVWEYNIEISKDLLLQGFDEIQFDYIRFPTDGVNLRNVVYPYRDKGMDKESALISFLSYARENVSAPISIDIYGANGWHRTGARTGQEVEMLQKYVDVICPMYYPSHFTQKFQYYKPFDQRTYRIYYYGSFRNYFIAKRNSLVRSWIQVFKMNVSYDRAFYGPNYVSNQILGVDESINQGYTMWNAANKYQILLKTVLNKKKEKNKESKKTVKKEDKKKSVNG